MTNPWTPILRAYLQTRRARGDLAASSRQTARYLLSDLAAGLDAAGISPFDDATRIADAVVDWADRPTWGTRTRATNLGYVRPMFDWAATRGRMTAGVAAQLPNPRRTRALPRALPDAQVDAVINATPDERARVIVLLEAQCGLRRVEVARITMRDIDLAAGSIRVLGKGDRERVVYPSPETIDAIRALLVVRGRGPGALICHTNRPGKPLTPTWVGVLVSRWMVDAGLKTAPGDGVSGHALRHSAATAMLRGGANIRVVQEALGHESIATTALYLKAQDEEVRAAMASVRYGRRLKPVS